MRKERLRRLISLVSTVCVALIAAMLLVNGVKGLALVESMRREALAYRQGFTQQLHGLSEDIGLVGRAADGPQSLQEAREAAGRAQEALQKLQRYVDMPAECAALERALRGVQAALPTLEEGDGAFQAAYAQVVSALRQVVGRGPGQLEGYQAQVEDSIRGQLERLLAFGGYALGAVLLIAALTVWLRQGRALGGVVGAAIVEFTAGGRALGLPVDHIAQVLPYTPASPAPGGAPALEGVLAREGERVPVVDVAALLGLKSLPAGGRDYYLLIRPGELLALHVRAVSGVYDIGWGNLRRRGRLPRRLRFFTRACVRVGEKTALVLEEEKILWEIRRLRAAEHARQAAQTPKDTEGGQ